MTNPNPDDNRILAMVCEMFADMHESAGSHQSAAKVREYAQRFQPEPEPKPEPRYHTRHAEVWEDNDFIFTCANGQEAQRAVEALYDAAKGGTGG